MLEVKSSVILPETLSNKRVLKLQRKKKRLHREPLRKQNEMNIKNSITALSLLTATLSSTAQNRVVLIEQFTNSGCYICANYSPTIFDYADNNSADVVAIAYHTAFPYNDSMYHENSIESDARVNYYGVAGVPYSIVDGNYYENASSVFVPQLATTINTRKTEAPLYSIAESNSGFNSNVIDGEFVFTSNTSSNTTDSLVAHIVVVEKNVLKSAYAASPGNNTETEYGYVMRKMLPNQNGTLLLHKAINESDTISFSALLSNIKNLHEVRIVAFVQNVTTKEVYNSFLFNPQITNINEERTLDNTFKIYPNPLANRFTVSATDGGTFKSINIINLQGAIVYGYTSATESSFASLDIDIPAGMYFIEITNDAQRFVQRIVISK